MGEGIFVDVGGVLLVVWDPSAHVPFGETVMTAVTFDTLKFVETLKASGFDESQARGMTVAIQDVQKANLDGLVTKHDLEKELSPIRTDLAVLKWMVGMQMAGIIALILKSFFPH
ncbi:MAG: CCDC90 family protein [Magnetococcus sp. MYC-9]